MIETLMEKKSNCLLPFFKNCVVEGYSLDLLKELDKGRSHLDNIDYHLFDNFEK